MVTGYKSSHRVHSLLAICLISAGVCGAQSVVQAGPSLETTQNTAIGAQATFNNNWAQTFEVKGAMSVEGDPTFALIPFQAISPDIIEVPTSGLAIISANVSDLVVGGGTLGANAEIGVTDTSGIILNASEVSGSGGLPLLRLKPGATDSSVIGASIIGTNIGTDTLQVTGSLSTNVINNLTAF